MSSVKKLSYLSSSSFRAALLACLVIWLSVSLIAYALHGVVVDTFVGNVKSELREKIGHAEQVIEAGAFYHPELYPEFESPEPLQLAIEEASASQFLRDYLADIYEHLEAEQAVSEKTLLYTRLLLLGEPVMQELTEQVLSLPSRATDSVLKPLDVSPLSAVPVHLVVDLLYEEFPEEYHRIMESLIEPRLDDWSGLNPTEFLGYTRSVKLFLEAEGLLEEEELCLALEDASQQVLVTNSRLYRPGELVFDDFFTVLIDREQASRRYIEERPEVCLVTALQLPDGGRLFVGQSFVEGYFLLLELDRILVLGTLGSLLLAVFSGYWISRRAMRKISAINGLCEQVSQGNMQIRLEANASGDDFDKLANNINRMLDRIESLMNGIKQVSDNIAHDLKTPLSRLRGRLELLSHMQKPDKEAVASVIQETDRIIDCFSALLRISQIEQGTRRKAFHRFDLAEVCHTLIDVYEPSITEQKLNFAPQIPDAPCVVYGDREQWLQAIANLLDNAIKYSPEGGVLDIQLCEKDNRWLLVLQDSGPGIPDTEKERVFERFYRMESHRGSEGNGLGLSLVAAVCKLHQAEVKLVNNQGLRVELLVPKADQG